MYEWGIPRKPPCTKIGWETLGLNKVTQGGSRQFCSHCRTLGEALAVSFSLMYNNYRAVLIFIHPSSSSASLDRMWPLHMLPFPIWVSPKNLCQTYVSFSREKETRLSEINPGCVCVLGASSVVLQAHSSSCTPLQAAFHFSLLKFSGSMKCRNAGCPQIWYQAAPEFRTTNYWLLTSVFSPD